MQSLLIGRPPADERGGVWGTGRFPTLSRRRGHAGETWFPLRTRVEDECSRFRVYHHVGDRRYGLAHALLDRTRAAVGIGERLPATEGESEEDDDPVVGAHATQLARLDARLVPHGPLDDRGVDVDL